jgi:hypothetical protein
LLKVSTQVLEKINVLNDNLKEREEERIHYDHYRNKVTKMQKEGISESNDEIKQEKFTRN